MTWVTGDYSGAMDAPAGPEDLVSALAGTGYVCDADLATVGWLALDLQRPVLLEGAPGTGKTSFAEAIAAASGVPLIRLHIGLEDPADLMADLDQALTGWRSRSYPA